MHLQRAMMRSTPTSYLSPKMSKRNSRPRGNTEKVKGNLGLILCIFLLIQEVNFPIKQVSSHLDFICPLKLASEVKLYSLSSESECNPGKGLSLLPCSLTSRKGENINLAPNESPRSQESSKTSLDHPKFIC